ncbi:uncharacterized protein LOC117222555 [Megalopta genalis]|uniref:uncharacterized protein LOC117222555 n=1 Tax=Megalopta genalis TaxID=115081 RepID=UPI003FD43692
MFESTRRLSTLECSESWRPYRATNFLSLMYPNIVFSKILGFFPYKCTPSEFVFSDTRFLLSAITQLVYVVLLASALYNANINIEKSTVEVIDRNVFLISEGIMVLVMYGLSNQRYHLFKKLGKLSRMLSEQDFQNMAKFVHTKDIFGIIFLILHLPNCIVGLNETTLSCLTVLYVLMVYLALDMTYMNCVYVLRACFVKINENLKQLNEHEEPCLATVSPHRGRSFLLLVKLKYCEELHQETSDVVQCLNKAFLFRIVIAAIITFTGITFNMYFAILGYGVTVWMKRRKSFWYLPHLEAVTFYLSKFVMMVLMCESAMKKAQEIGTTIHEILSECTDETVKRELRMFALQVLHRDNKFSAKAIAMDARLLTQIVGGIIMYILILFQFLINDAACRNVEHIDE